MRSSTETRIATASWQLAGLIFVGLLLVWLLLFRVVHRASRRLQEQSRENEQLALLDPLSGLPNRRLLSERLERAALLSRRTGARVGLLLLDKEKEEFFQYNAPISGLDKLQAQALDRETAVVPRMGESRA